MRFASISRRNGSLGSEQASIVGCSSRITGHVGLARAVAGVELRLELVQRGEPVALALVAEDVDEPREAVDRAQVRPELAREEQRRDGEVLRPRAGSHLWNRQRHATMLAVRAMVLDSPGSPLREAELPDPEPAQGEILVAVSACGVCRTDLHIVDGELTEPKLPLVPGHQVVGRAITAGERLPRANSSASLGSAGRAASAATA